MNKKLLELEPKRYLCPYCGQWHDWPEEDDNGNYPQSLGWYDGPAYTAKLHCNGVSINDWQGKYYFYFADGYFHYSVHSLCSDRRKEWLNSKVPISDIAESTERPIVTFELPVDIDRYVGRESCFRCRVKNVCSLYKQALKSGDKNLKIQLGFEFDEEEYKQFATHLTAKNENKSTTRQITEETTMANNLFNLNIEFGMNTDKDIASTLMGIAVKNGDSWRIYDKAKGKITDLGGIELGNLPLYIVPTTKLTVGDLIKEDGEYYSVKEIAASSITTICMRTGVIKTAVPVKNILGIDCYSKVVAFVEPADIAGDMDTEKLLMMSAMSGQLSGDGSQATQMNQLAPLLLLSDNLGGDDDITKIALVSAMSAQQPGEGGVPANQMSQLAPLMLLSDNLGGSDDMTKMILMSSMMGGNNAAASNPLMGVMMLKMLDKKVKGQPTTPAQLPAAPEQQYDAEETDQSSQQPDDEEAEQPSQQPDDEEVE